MDYLIERRRRLPGVIASVKASAVLSQMRGMYTYRSEMKRSMVMVMPLFSDKEKIFSFQYSYY